LAGFVVKPAKVFTAPTISEAVKQVVSYLVEREREGPQP
jgi:hypothetical protein